MVIRKVQKGNKNGVSVVNIPAEFVTKYGMVPGAYINFDDSEDILKIAKVQGV